MGAENGGTKENRVKLRKISKITKENTWKGLASMSKAYLEDVHVCSFLDHLVHLVCISTFYCSKEFASKRRAETDTHSWTTAHLHAECRWKGITKRCARDPPSHVRHDQVQGSHGLWTFSPASYLSTVIMMHGSLLLGQTSDILGLIHFSTFTSCLTLRSRTETARTAAMLPYVSYGTS